MPELPEVETVRRSLEPVIVGQRILGVTVGAFEGVLGGMSPEHAASALIGSTVSNIRRRGKYLLLDLDHGGGVEVHLRMTGHLESVPTDSAPVRFQHLAIHFANGTDLRFSDQRKFGRVIVHGGDPGSALHAKLGPEPLEPSFTAGTFASALARRPGPIKGALLDQKLVAGIGNIYADEALFISRIHPLRSANSLTPTEIAKLHRAIRRVLRDGIEDRGTTFSTYRDGFGEEGSHQHRLQVYGRGRGGLPCPRCKRPVEFVTVSQRTSHFCPRCQPNRTPDR